MKLSNRSHRTVTNDQWGVSCTTGTGINGAILHVYRSRIRDIELPYKKWMHGMGDGKLFPNEDLAFQWAFDHGYLKLYFTSPSLRAHRIKSAAKYPRIIR